MKTIIRVLIFFLFTPSVIALAQSESDIVITEIYYNQIGNDTLEFLELHNKGASAINLQGYYFSSGLSLTFPSYSLASGAYVAVVRDKPEFQSHFNITNAIQWESGALSNSGEKIVLKDPAGNIADSVEYDDNFPWPDRADGEGPSLMLCDPLTDNSTYMNWNLGIDFAPPYKGSNVFASPGRRGTVCTAPGDIVPPEITTARTISLTQVRLNFSEPVTNLSNPVNYSQIGISNIAVQSETEVLITLSNPISENTRYNLYIHNLTDTVSNPMDTTLVHVGYNISNPDLIITEILYDHPGSDSLEFLEVKYVGASEAQLGGLFFSSGLTFMFPTLTVQPDQYIILADSPNDIAAYYGAPVGYEWEAGSLDNTGEKLLISNSSNDTVFYLQYDTIVPWPDAHIVNASIITCTENENEVNDGTRWSFHPSTGKLPFASPGADNPCQSVGVHDQALANIRIYPVPAENHLNIELEEKGNYILEISDLAGNTHLKTEIMNSDRHRIETGPYLQPGVYLLTIQKQNTAVRISKKVVVY